SVVAHLVQDKAGNVGTRYGSSVEAGQVRERANRASAGFVVENRGPNEDPCKPAIPYDRLLPVLVGVDLTQEERKDQVVEQKSAVTDAVAGADPRNADEPRDFLTLHCVHERACCGRKKRDLAERASRCAERTDDSVSAFEGLSQHILVTRIACDKLRAL